MMNIETPFLWLGLPIKGTPKPWKRFKVEGLMVNAYNIIDEIGMQGNGKKIHQFLNYKGPILMDSGGFQFMKRNVLDIKCSEVLKLYTVYKPNYAVILDHPIGPNLSRNQIKKRQIKTINNTKKMWELHGDSNPQLIPVIHGHDEKSLNWFINKLEKIADFDTVGVGSLVPTLYNIKGVVDIHEIIEILPFLRERLPDKKIHIFGIGSVLMMHLMYYLGMNSVDSSSWRIKAAYGAIQLPGTPDRYITPMKRKKNYRYLSKDEAKLLESCKCPACKEFSLAGLKKSFSLRALHNSWVYQQEVKLARKLMKKNRYDEYVENILTTAGQRYGGLLQIVKRLKTNRLYSQ